jgi:hypothetical protein
MTIEKIKSIQDIIAWAESLEDKPNRLFRGQKHSWELKPSIFRDGCRKSGEEFDENKFLEAIETFAQRARNYLGYDLSSFVEKMAYAQHHGFPTLLLDWTNNPLIAAYFACCEMGAGNTDRQATLYSVADLTENVEHPVFLYKPSIKLARLDSQQSCFTFQKETFSFETDKTIKLETIQIDRNCEGAIKAQLSKIGIDAHTIFRSLDGLGESLYWKYKWNKPIR